MGIIQVFKLVGAYNKAKKIVKKNKASVDEIKESIENLKALVKVLQAGKDDFVNEIKKVKDLTAELVAKIEKETK